jgi:autotransporter-associated beta strand protein
MGGAIFVMQGGSLTIGGTLTINGNTVTAGVAGGGGTTAGSAFGSGLFMQGSGTITFQPGAGQVQTIANTIADEAGVVAGAYSPPAGFGTPGSWSLTKDGGGTLILSGANTYSGGTNFNAGIVSVSADNNLGANTGALTFNGGTLQFGASFNLATTRTITLNAGGGTIDTNGFDTTISQGIGGAGGLTKTGAGTLMLSGSSTYSGATAVNAGTLQAGAANTFAPNSAFTVASGATLNLAEPQSDHRLARRRGQRDAGLSHAHHRQRQHQHHVLRRDLRHRRADQDRQRRANAIGQQHVFWRYHDQRRHAGRVSGQQSRQQLGRPRLRRRHLAVLVGLHQQSRGHAELGRRHIRYQRQ